MDSQWNGRLADVAGGLPESWQPVAASPPWNMAARRWTMPGSSVRGEWYTFDQPAALDWFGPRLGWLTQPLPARPLAGLASSHLGSDLFPHGQWLSSLRQAVTLGGHRYTWLVVPPTTCSQLTRTAANRLGLTWLDVQLPAARSVDAWGRWRQRLQQLHQHPPRHPCLVLSPCLTSGHPSETTSTGDSKAPIPLADAVLFGLSELLVVLAARPGSRTAKALQRRRSEAKSPAHRTIVLPCPVAPVARRWDHPTPLSASFRLISRLPWPALLHWTRSIDGPWPGQSPDEYLAQLLLQSHMARRSPLDTLRKILRDRCLRASAAAIGGCIPVVCFTEQPLERWHELRRYRRHRRRWDFEPYGIALRRDALRRRGARRVRYAAEARQRGPAPSRQAHWRQRTATADGRIDWRIEREWRIVGDLCLRPLEAHDMAVFVPNRSAARRLNGIARCPILIIDDCRSRTTRL